MGGGVSRNGEELLSEEVRAVELPIPMVRERSYYGNRYSKSLDFTIHWLLPVACSCFATTLSPKNTRREKMKIPKKRLQPKTISARLCAE